MQTDRTAGKPLAVRLATPSLNSVPDEIEEALSEILGECSMLTSTPLTASDLDGWIRSLWLYLMVEREATVNEVARAFHDHLAADKWFPRIADLTWRVEAMVHKRQNLAATNAAFRDPQPVPELPDGDVDWSKVPTWRLPFNYDYTTDRHWQLGKAMEAEIPVRRKAAR